MLTRTSFANILNAPNAGQRIKEVFAVQSPKFAQKYMRRFVGVMAGLMKMNVRRIGKALVLSIVALVAGRMSQVRLAAGSGLP